SHIDPGVPLARRLDKRVGRIDRRHIHCSEPRSELSCERAGAAADVERATFGLDARVVGKEWSELLREPPHEAFIGTRRREELTHRELGEALLVVPRPVLLAPLR